VLLFIGATGKSAQIPLLTWLPDAMAGPTPVSALIHAATMVTAGVYLVVRANAIYQFAPTAMWIIAVIGAATAIFAATMRSRKTTLKGPCLFDRCRSLALCSWRRVLERLSLAIFHVMTHAFFKALLFLGSGSIYSRMHHEQDMRKMGNLKKYMPITFFTMLQVGSQFAVFHFSQDSFLKMRSSTGRFAADNYFPPEAVSGRRNPVDSSDNNCGPYRCLYDADDDHDVWGKERFHDALPGANITLLSTRMKTHDNEEEHHHALPHDFKPHESPWSMTVPLIVLGILSAFGGLVGVPYAMSSILSTGEVNVFRARPGASRCQRRWKKRTRRSDRRIESVSRTGC
jgi:NADH-quinone oxidoreductase subunit L